MKRWINTEVISQWNEKTQRYETVSSEGYWHEGDVDMLEGYLSPTLSCTALSPNGSEMDIADVISNEDIENFYVEWDIIGNFGGTSYPTDIGVGISRQTTFPLHGISSTGYVHNNSVSCDCPYNADSISQCDDDDDQETRYRIVRVSSPSEIHPGYTEWDSVVYNYNSQQGEYFKQNNYWCNTSTDDINELACWNKQSYGSDYLEIMDKNKLQEPILVYYTYNRSCWCNVSCHWQVWCNCGNGNSYEGTSGQGRPCGSPPWSSCQQSACDICNYNGGYEGCYWVQDSYTCNDHNSTTVGDYNSMVLDYKFGCTDDGHMGQSWWNRYYLGHYNSQGFTANIYPGLMNDNTPPSNYDPNACIDDGSCQYVEDCNGILGGQSFYDDCGDCVDPYTTSPNCFDPTYEVEGLIDADGNVYQTVWIGQQLWMSENLRTTHYNNGDDVQFWDYSNNSSNSETYGRLYNWHTVNDERGICPVGWHVPSWGEFSQLHQFLNGTSVAGGKLKEVGLEHWNSPNTGATNESGFTGLPGGYRNPTNGSYGNIGNVGFLWSSSTGSNVNDGYYQSMSNNSTNVIVNAIGKSFGMSVRCVSDEVLNPGCTEYLLSNLDYEFFNMSWVDNVNFHGISWSAPNINCQGVCDDTTDNSGLIADNSGIIDELAATAALDGCYICTGGSTGLDADDYTDMCNDCSAPTGENPFGYLPWNHNMDHCGVCWDGGGSFDTDYYDVWEYPYGQFPYANDCLFGCLDKKASNWYCGPYSVYNDLVTGYEHNYWTDPEPNGVSIENSLCDGWDISSQYSEFISSGESCIYLTGCTDFKSNNYICNRSDGVQYDAAEELVGEYGGSVDVFDFYNGNATDGTIIWWDGEFICDSWELKPDITVHDNGDCEWLQGCPDENAINYVCNPNILDISGGSVYSYAGDLWWDGSSICNAGRVRDEVGVSCNGVPDNDMTYCCRYQAGCPDNSPTTVNYYCNVAFNEELWWDDEPICSEGTIRDSISVGCPGNAYQLRWDEITESEIGNTSCCYDSTQVVFGCDNPYALNYYCDNEEVDCGDYNYSWIHEWFSNDTPLESSPGWLYSKTDCDLSFDDSPYSDCCNFEDYDWDGANPVECGATPFCTMYSDTSNVEIISSKWRRAYNTYENEAPSIKSIISRPWEAGSGETPAEVLDCASYDGNTCLKLKWAPNDGTSGHFKTFWFQKIRIGSLTDTNKLQFQIDQISDNPDDNSRYVAVLPKDYFEDVVLRSLANGEWNGTFDDAPLIQDIIENSANAYFKVQPMTLNSLPTVGDTGPTVGFSPSNFQEDPGWDGNINNTCTDCTNFNEYYIVYFVGYIPSNVDDMLVDQSSWDMIDNLSVMISSLDKDCTGRDTFFAGLPFYDFAQSDECGICSVMDPVELGSDLTGLGGSGDEYFHHPNVICIGLNDPIQGCTENGQRIGPDFDCHGRCPWDGRTDLDANGFPITAYMGACDVSTYHTDAGQKNHVYNNPYEYQSTYMCTNESHYGFFCNPNEYNSPVIHSPSNHQSLEDFVTREAGWPCPDDCNLVTSEMGPTHICGNDYCGVCIENPSTNNKSDWSVYPPDDRDFIQDESGYNGYNGTKQDCHGDCKDFTIEWDEGAGGTADFGGPPQCRVCMYGNTGRDTLPEVDDCNQCYEGWTNYDNLVILLGFEDGCINPDGSVVEDVCPENWSDMGCGCNTDGSWVGRKRTYYVDQDLNQFMYEGSDIDSILSGQFQQMLDFNGNPIVLQDGDVYLMDEDGNPDLSLRKDFCPSHGEICPYYGNTTDCEGIDLPALPNIYQPFNFVYCGADLPPGEADENILGDWYCGTATELDFRPFRLGCTDQNANNYDFNATMNDPQNPCTYDHDSNYVIFKVDFLNNLDYMYDLYHLKYGVENFGINIFEVNNVLLDTEIIKQMDSIEVSGQDEYYQGVLDISSEEYINNGDFIRYYVWIEGDDGIIKDFVVRSILINRDSPTYTDIEYFYNYTDQDKFRSSLLPIVKITESEFKLIFSEVDEYNQYTDVPSLSETISDIQTIYSENSKESFDIEFANNVSILGIEGDVHWNLDPVYIDKSHMRSELGYHIWKSMEDDRYSINSKFVNLIYNDEYRGLYLLKEIVKEGDNRVNLEILPENNVVINEFFSKGEEYSVDPDWIELYNPTGDIVNLQGWELRNLSEGEDFKRAEGDTVIWRFPVNVPHLTTLCPSGKECCCLNSSDVFDPGTNNCASYEGLVCRDILTIDADRDGYIYGCTDPTAFRCDDGDYDELTGTFMDPYGCFNPLADEDDGSCIYCISGCMDIGAQNYKDFYTYDIACGTCEDGISGHCDYTSDSGSCCYNYGCNDSRVICRDNIPVVVKDSVDQCDGYNDDGTWDFPCTVSAEGCHWDYYSTNYDPDVDCNDYTCEFEYIPLNTTYGDQDFLLDLMDLNNINMDILEFCPSEETYGRRCSWEQDRLVEFECDTCGLESLIPQSIGNLTRLRTLTIKNTNMGGNLPEEFNSTYLTQLSSLDFSNNQFTGQIPYTLPSMISMYYLNLSNNQFSGLVPPNFGNYGYNNGIHDVYLNDNQLTGFSDNTICFASNLNTWENENFDISNNNMCDENIPECIENYVGEQECL